MVKTAALDKMIGRKNSLLLAILTFIFSVALFGVGMALAIKFDFTVAIILWLIMALIESYLIYQIHKSDIEKAFSAGLLVNLFKGTVEEKKEKFATLIERIEKEFDEKEKSGKDPEK